VQIGGLEVFAAVAADQPHRLTGLMAVPLGRQITDPRVAAPALARMTGEVAAGMGEIAAEASSSGWLAGLAAVVFLWRATSSAYFKAIRS